MLSLGKREKVCCVLCLAYVFIYNPNLYSELEGNNTQVSEQGSRKVLYQKVSGARPALR